MGCRSRWKGELSSETPFKTGVVLDCGSDVRCGTDDSLWRMGRSHGMRLGLRPGISDDQDEDNRRHLVELTWTREKAATASGAALTLLIPREGAGVDGERSLSPSAVESPDGLAGRREMVDV